MLLALTGYRKNRLKVHWLRADGGVLEAELNFAGSGFPSLSPYLPEVAWDEREIHDLYGYLPEGHPDLRPLIRTPRWPENFHPLRGASGPLRGADSLQSWKPDWLAVEPDNPAKTVEGAGVTVMKVGPTHAGIIESGHFVFSLIGENILYLDAHLFQNHRGVEKVLEALSLEQVLPIVSRVCGADSVSHQVNFVSAVEHLAGRQLPEQIRWQRIVLLESERILSHLNDLAQIPAGVGFQVAHQRGLVMKEKWQRGLADAFGHRFLFDTVGFAGMRGHGTGAGLNSAMGSAWDLDTFLKVLESLEQEWVSWRRLVDNHHGFIDRMQGVGVVSRADAVRLGAAGVALRATGMNMDARTWLPLYEGVPMEVVKADGGDVKARFRVRLEEVEASVRMIQHAVKQLLASGVSQSVTWQPPADLTGEVVSYSESPHGLNVHVMEFNHGVVARYHIRSGAFRNWPVLAAALAGNAVADFPLINKSFELCYSCCDR